MAFPDPLILTYAGASKSLVLVGRQKDESTYQLVDTGNVTYQMLLKHQFPDLGKAGRFRGISRLTRAALINDPLIDQNRLETLTVTLTADWSSLHGPADAQSLYAALLTFLTASNFLKLAAGET